LLVLFINEHKKKLTYALYGSTFKSNEALNDSLNFVKVATNLGGHLRIFKTQSRSSYLESSSTAFSQLSFAAVISPLRLELGLRLKTELCKRL
jgi:hypothetical protein